MDWVVATGQVFEAFDAELRRHPPGTAARVEHAIGKRLGYLRKIQQRKRVRVDTLLRCLEVLEVEPLAFFARAFPMLVRLGAGFSDTMLVGGLLRFVTPGAAQRSDLQLVLAGEKGDVSVPATEVEIERLDRLRYSEPPAARDRARAIARDAGARGQRRVALRAAGVWGSSLRLCYDFEGAWAVLVRALENAHRDEALQAELLRRLAVLATDEAQPRLADELFQQAILIHLDRGENHEVARRQVDRAGVFSEFGEPKRAVETTRTALVALPLEDRRYRCSAIIMQGFAQLQLGSLDESRQCLVLARDIVDRMSDLEARTLWLQARLGLASGEFEEATAAFEKSIECFEDQSGDRAVVTVEFVRALIESGDCIRAREVARSMASIVLYVRNPILESAVSDLVRSALVGDVTLAMVLEFEDALDRSARSTAGQRNRKESG